MKKLYSILIAILICTVNTFAQNSYIVPDIVAPGMNIYCEIVAPADQFNYFGVYDFSYNVINDNLEVAIDDPELAKEIIVSPVISSWYGRLLSFHLFVPEKLTNMPKSSIWSDVTNPSFRVIVKNAGVLINLYKVTIVNPWTLGDISSLADRKFGEGQLGRRSKNGVMIVDSLVLAANATYSVSTNDPDADLNNGHQGYMPFVLLSKGNILANNATINVNATSTKHGGPGGGGGSGRFADNVLGNKSGTNGGNGFTGGSRGVRWNSAGSPTHYEPGQGTGAMSIDKTYAGLSMNDVLGGSDGNSHESGGGGTGFPFGLSGVGCNNGSSCNPEGGVGAGSGWNDSQRGGNAAHSTASPVAGSHHGKVYGNIMCIPLAGGSGGGSGNPRAALGAESGEGGGGGGAIRIYAPMIDKLKNVEAKGANGGSGSPDGGSGSGGMIEINVRLTSDVQGIDVSGGTNAGAGRVRENGLTQNWNYLPNNLVSKFNGTSTDTLHWVKNIAKINGKKAPNIPIKLYAKSKSTDWANIFTIDDASYSWTYDLDMTTYFPDSTVYFTVSQVIANPSKVDYQNEPAEVFSQSASNVFTILPLGRCESSSYSIDSILTCGPDSLSGSFKLYNRGTTSLRIYSMNASSNPSKWAFGNQGFEVTSLINGKPPILRDDSLKIDYKFKAPAGQTGTFVDTLYIYNDGEEDNNNNPLKILFKVTYEKVQIELRDMNNKNISSGDLFITNLCMNDVDSVAFQIHNFSSIDINIESLKMSNTTDFSLRNENGNVIKANESTKVWVIFKDNDLNQKFDVTATAYIKIKECDWEDSIHINVNVVVATLSPVDVTQFDFGDSRLLEIKKRQIEFVNTGNANAFIQDFPIVNPPFKFVSSIPSLPAFIAPGNKITFTVEYTPQVKDKLDTENTRLISLAVPQNSCDTIYDFVLSGRGLSSTIDYPTDPINFGIWLDCEEMQSDSTILIRNLSTSNSSFKLTPKWVLSGNDASFFEITSEPSVGIEVQANQSTSFKIRFKSKNGSVGIKTAKLTIFTDDPLIPSFDINLIGEITTRNILANPQTLDFGQVPMNSSSTTLNLRLTNPSKKDRIIRQIIPSAGIITSISPLVPQTIFANNGFVDFSVNWTPDFEGKQNAEIQFLIDEGDCEDIVIVNMEIEGLKANVSVSNPAFDELYPCASQEQVLEIKNEGLVDVTVKAIRLEGKDLSLFAFKDPNLQSNLPFVLNAGTQGNNAPIGIVFNPNYIKMTSGIKTVDFVVVIIENGVEVEYRRAFNVVVSSGVVVTPTEIDFGNVVKGVSKTLKLTVRREGKWDVITETSPSLSLYPTIFKYNKNLIDNQLLALGVDYSMDITFNPTDYITYIDTLFIPINIYPSLNCPDTLKIVLKGNGIEAATILISIPKFQNVNPSSRDFKIPIYARIEKGADTLQNINIDTLALSYANEIFYTQNTAGANIFTRLNDTEQTGTAKIYLEIKNIALKKEDTKIAELSGFVILRDKEQTDIKIEQVVNTQYGSISKINTANGALHIEVCKTNNGDRYILKNKKFNTNVRVENSTEYIAAIETDESGFYVVNLINSIGNLVNSSSWTKSSDEIETKEIIFDLNNYPSGVYFIQILSQNGQAVEAIYNVK